MRADALLLSVLIAGLFLVGCGPAPDFHENTKIDPNGWKGSDAITYTFDISDTQQAYDFILSLRHSEAYPYSNLFLFVQLDFPNGKTSVDTLECVLADERGRWNGKRTGQLVDHRILMNSRKIFPLEGTYHLKIRQAMRRDPLPELHDVGFSLVKWEGQ